MKRALCIGIGYGGSANALPGSIQTASDLQKVLKARGFSTTLLIEKKATRQALSETIGNMLASAADPLVITWSGHAVDLVFTDGSHIYALVPYDCGMSHDWNLSIPTYQVAAKFKQRTGPLCTIMDVCFSAGFRADENPFGPVRQSIPPQFLPGAPAFEDFAGVPMRRAIYDYQALNTLQASGTGYVSMHPCKATEESVQMKFGSVWRSLFSEKVRSLALKPLSKKQNYLAFFKTASAAAQADYPLATPVCFGDQAMMKRIFLT